ncbi:hypothetical protein [Desulfoluna spongiiphila]|uniref:hypothetical protein n=1 Tax=Desulfoluna spongiiphila TaxID=419481 RepID=UPI001D01BC15|nr:hypothetical protein [Desulfoluna spongiiphila]
MDGERTEAKGHVRRPESVTQNGAGKLWGEYSKRRGWSRVGGYRWRYKNERCGLIFMKMGAMGIMYTGERDGVFFIDVFLAETPGIYFFYHLFLFCHPARPV